MADVDQHRKLQSLTKAVLASVAPALPQRTPNESSPIELQECLQIMASPNLVLRLPRTRTAGFAELLIESAEVLQSSKDE